MNGEWKQWILSKLDSHPEAVSKDDYKMLVPFSHQMNSEESRF